MSGGDMFIYRHCNVYVYVCVRVLHVCMCMQK